VIDNLASQLYKPIGFTGARRKDDHQLVARFVSRQDPPGHRIDSFGIDNRSASVFLHYKSHPFEFLPIARMLFEVAKIR
jgi:hypothetical protein